MTLSIQCCNFVSDKRRYTFYSRRIQKAPCHGNMVLCPFGCSCFSVFFISLKWIRYTLHTSCLIFKCEDKISKIWNIRKKLYCTLVTTTFCAHSGPHNLVFLFFFDISTFGIGIPSFLIVLNLTFDLLVPW